MMRPAAFLIVGLASAAWCAGAGAQSVPGGAGAFDGAWSGTADCPASADGAPSIFYALKVQVSGDLLQGEHGASGEPGWLTVDGVIQADGAANLQVVGVRGSAPQYGAHAPPVRTQSYRLAVKAHFSARHGDGASDGSPACEFIFDRSSGAG
jgi:hypothetical protein